MSMTPPEMSSEVAPPPPKPGMSGGAKLLIVLGIVLGILVLLCCGGLIGTAYYFSTKVISSDPAVVAAKTGEITQIEIPAGLKPQMSFDMKVPFSGQRMMLWTVYLDEATDSTLVLFAFGEGTAPPNADQMQRQMDQSLRQQGMGQQEKITIKETDKKQVEIRGQPVTFTISKGVGEKSGSPRIQVTGVFQGKTGPAMLMFNADAEKYSEEEIGKMLESIK
jgi:hypothetical protein